MKKIFKIDSILYPIGLSTITTGFGLHITGHGSNHFVWEIWAYLHSAVAIALLAFVVWHLVTHIGWLKSICKISLLPKRIITLLFSLLMIVTVATGIALLAVWGANSHLGLWHYKIGIAFSVLMLIHGGKRLKILAKVYKSN